MGKVVARCRVLREIWRNFGGIVDSPLLTNDFAWYMYIIRRSRRKEEAFEGGKHGFAQTRLGANY